ncbi:MAG: hypothetical protein E7Y34_03225, partial [Mycoplasma sp.]|nr:hypothetical protein [Mycoplasma sp.]
ADKGGWPCLQSYIEEFEADGASGSNICVMEYEPKCGLIKSMHFFIVPSTYMSALNRSRNFTY